MKPLTSKQRALMKVIMLGNIDVKGNRIGWCDYTQILERLPYTTTRESLMCSIRILVNQGWITREGKELRDGRSKQTIAPTPIALRVIAGSDGTPGGACATPSYEEILTDDIVELVLE